MDDLWKKIRYPKLLILFITIIVAVILFHEARDYQPLHDFLISLGYFGAFAAGIFYAYGFTAAPATAVLLILGQQQNIFLAGFLGGLGALASDALIFLFVRYSFMDEIERFEHEKFVKYVEKEEGKIFGHYRKNIMPTFAGFLIASPLPTEIGVSLMATLKNLSVKKFMLLAYLLHTAGIFVILFLGNII